MTGATACGSDAPCMARIARPSMPSGGCRCRTWRRGTSSRSRATSSCSRSTARCVPEPPRGGEGGGACVAVRRRSSSGGLGPTTAGSWSPRRESPVPTVLLEPRRAPRLDRPRRCLAPSWAAHRAARACAVGLGGVGRVHVSRSATAAPPARLVLRPARGLLQLRGSSLSDWTDCCRSMPRDEWLGRSARDRAASAHRGQALAQRLAPGCHRTSPPAPRLAWRARMNSRSREPVEVVRRQRVHRRRRASSSAAQVERSARRTTVRATCR